MNVENEQDTNVGSSPNPRGGEVNLRREVEGIVFIEFFAGEAGLSAAVAARGITCDVPQDVNTGGADFGDVNDVLAVKAWLQEWKSNGFKLLLHFAPPCATFSRARDRSHKTRLRSTQRPQGLLGRGLACRTANRIARHTLDVIEWAVDELDAKVSMENPESSYIWLFLDFRTDLWFEDVVFSPCMFGADVYKPTKVRTWGWRPRRLDSKCTRSGENFACGRTRANPHTVLEFGGRSTATAAAYHPGVCGAWADDLLDLCSEMRTDLGAVKMTTMVGQGRVYRHLWRGTDAVGAKEVRDTEDQMSTAGMRNPAGLWETWPQLFDGLESLRALFITVRALFPGFQGLAGCCGEHPVREPPTEEEIAALRRCMAILYDVDPEKFRSETVGLALVARGGRGVARGDERHGQGLGEVSARRRTHGLGQGD